LGRFGDPDTIGFSHAPLLEQEVHSTQIERIRFQESDQKRDKENAARVFLIAGMRRVGRTGKPAQSIRKWYVGFSLRI
jgi:hypothetical protein